MPTSLPYFLDGSSLIDSTAVYLNSGLTLPAADGYYSDGVNIRQQIGGFLAPVQPCPSCGLPCTVDGSLLGGDEGEYRMTIDTGSLPGNTGAIVVRFRVGNAPDGMIVNYDGSVYNEFSSPLFGYLAGIPGGPTYLGNSSTLCPPGTLVGPHTLNVFNWDGTAFIPSGTTNSINVVSGNLALTPLAPDDPTNWSVLVVPKPSLSPSTIDITIYAPCDNTSFLFSVACAGKIKKINASVPYEDFKVEGFCEATLTYNLYPVRVTGVAPYIDKYDWVFIDENGANKAPDGFYRTNNVVTPYDSIEVQNGVIVDVFTAC